MRVSENLKLFGRRKDNNSTEASVSTNSEDQLATPCGGDERLHKAISNFLLLRPAEQISQLDSTETLIRKAESAGKGDQTTARISLETAARIEIYKGDKERVRMLLERAQQLSTDGSVNRETMLSKLDDVMRISREYYHQKQQSRTVATPITVTV
ncbi:MAG: hypothetical protein JRN15_21615 [Nitrososphaerota archaeon]|nr:hypothetical protein [Nitrososphaerota archaeon]